MILINLLPPELRRRQGGVSPMFISITAGGGACLLLLILWLYIIVIRIPNADRLIVEKTQELKEKTVKADEVLKIEAQIKEAQDRREQIVGLMLSKVYWARTLDEFATMLNGPFTVPGFDVRCQDLTISEAAALPGSRRPTGKPEAASVAFRVNWRYKLLGKERPLAGDYMKSFFDTIKANPFWAKQGFTGKPEDTYRGDTPRMNTKIGRVVIEGDLDWQRLKLVEDRARN
jgi:hypothetical protein